MLKEKGMPCMTRHKTWKKFGKLELVLVVVVILFLSEEGNKKVQNLVRNVSGLQEVLQEKVLSNCCLVYICSGEFL